MARAVQARNNQRPTWGIARVRILPAVITMVVLGTVSGTALAQSKSELAARECATIADATQRLACYDSLFSEHAGSRGSAAAGAPAAAATPVAEIPAPADPLAEFGLTEQQKERRRPQDAKSEPLEGIEATVTAAVQDRYGPWRLTLDNGQVWLQTETALGVRFQAGDRVEIRRGSLGSFVLKLPGRPMIRVRRVQ